MREARLTRCGSPAAPGAAGAGGGRHSGGHLDRRRISAPLTEAVQFAEQVASGDLTQQMEPGDGDEIGRLIASLNGMVPPPGAGGRGERGDHAGGVGGGGDRRHVRAHLRHGGRPGGATEPCRRPWRRSPPRSPAWPRAPNPSRRRWTRRRRPSPRWARPSSHRGERRGAGQRGGRDLHHHGGDGHVHRSRRSGTPGDPGDRRCRGLRRHGGGAAMEQVNGGMQRIHGRWRRWWRRSRSSAGRASPWADLGAHGGHRGPDQPAGAERLHRGGAGGRARPRLRRGRPGGAPPGGALRGVGAGDRHTIDDRPGPGAGGGGVHRGGGETARRRGSRWWVGPRTCSRRSWSRPPGRGTSWTRWPWPRSSRPGRPSRPRGHAPHPADRRGVPHRHAGAGAEQRQIVDRRWRA
jgi:hypothetical protein